MRWDTPHQRKQIICTSSLHHVLLRRASSEFHHPLTGKSHINDTVHHQTVNKRTDLRLQFSASGSKTNILCLVNIRSNTNTKKKTITRDNHWIQLVPPLLSWYDAKAKKINSKSRATWIFWRRFMVVDSCVIETRGWWLGETEVFLFSVSFFKESLWSRAVS